MDPAEKPARKSSKTPTASRKKATGFTAEEMAAMRERVEELKTEGRGRRAPQPDGESAVLAKIAGFPQTDRAIAERLHAIVKANAPTLTPKTWYGMPAYARDGNVVCFFQSAQKFKTRYATLGFSDKAKLDAGNMWPTAFALQEMTAAEEAAIAKLLKKALR